MSSKNLKVGVVGATGMVGQTFMNILAERKFPLQFLKPFASEKSLGQKIDLMGKSYPIEVLKPGCFDGLDLVFFSSGDDISKEWAPLAAKAGAFAVDNSAAFRMDADKILCVPEVNGDLLDQIKGKPQVIANPNCTTIQLVVALSPLLKNFGMREVRISSYQAVSGAGIEAYNELLAQAADSLAQKQPQAKVFPHPIAFNCIPQIGSFLENGFTGEEMKVMKETRKILRHEKMRVSAFTIRVPVLNAHAEAVWVTLDKKISKEEIVETLRKAPGLVIEDDPKNSRYPQQYKASGTDPVYVGRIHRDLDDEHTWLLWIVADNIRKGAALNGIQIAERIFDIR
jgi:aspartate-semialdehyde dehydrogenase